MTSSCSSSASEGRAAASRYSTAIIPIAARGTEISLRGSGPRELRDGLLLLGTPAFLIPKARDNR